MPLVLGLVLALAGGGAGFLAVSSGLIGEAGGAFDRTRGADLPPPMGPVAFVALDPLIVNLSGQAGRQYLRFSAQLEVAPEFLSEIQALRPRIIDVLNGYLRAVQPADLEDPTALMRLRAQMLRRVQIVAGQDRVRDLLIMEFVIN